MTELQLGLLAVGAVVVAGVFAYNRVLERRVRRIFSLGHDDVLRGELGARAPAPQRPDPQPQPDERIDYVIEIALHGPVAPAALDELWQPIQRRHSPRATLAANQATPVWKAGLQLVSRAGSIGEA
ncbi:MAG: hypothetical protein FJY47_09515, partial [Betaproteobacteria bacterium]|nr:hypothetical protein [Betaproteobacteria bacterium]